MVFSQSKDIREKKQTQTNLFWTVWIGKYQADCLGSCDDSITGNLWEDLKQASVKTNTSPVDASSGRGIDEMASEPSQPYESVTQKEVIRFLSLQKCGNK